MIFNLVSLAAAIATTYFWWSNNWWYLKLTLVLYGAFFIFLFFYGFIETTSDQVRDMKKGNFKPGDYKKYLERWL